MGKKLIGVYLPISLLKKLKKYILDVYLRTGINKSRSEVIEEAVEEYLDKRIDNSSSD